MSSSDDKPAVNPEDLYQQSLSDLAQLQTRLPEEAVVSLAREVIQRLAVKLREATPRDARVEALATALTGREAKAAAQLVEQYLRDGVDVDTIYLDYLGLAAQRLGEWWETDQLTFAEVTVGIGRIYAIIRTLRPYILSDAIPNNKSAIFASVPEEDHTLGIKMAADLAREAGWEIELLLDMEHDALVEAISTSEPALVGLSGAGAHTVPHLARLVVALRIGAPRSLILVSGNVVETSRDAICLMHVDAMESTFEGAMKQLGQLWSTLGRSRLQ